MKVGNTVQRTCALGLWVLLTVGGWRLVTGADRRPKATTTLSAAVASAFHPCHPPGADLSPDGKVFVTVQPDQPQLGLLDIGPEQTNRFFALPKPAADAVFLDTTRIVVAFGPWGELAVLDTQQATVSPPFRVGASAGALCRLAGGRVVVLDTKQHRLYVVEPQAKAIVKTLPVPPKTAQLGWAVPELTLAVADAQGQRLGTIALPYATALAQGGAR